MKTLNKESSATRLCTTRRISSYSRVQGRGGFEDSHDGRQILRFHNVSELAHSRLDHFDGIDPGDLRDTVLERVLVDGFARGD